MPLPVHSDSRVRREYGRNLIRSIRSFESTKLSRKGFGLTYRENRVLSVW